HARGRWNHLLQQLKPLAAERLAGKDRKPCYVTTWPGQTCDEPCTQGIAGNEHDRRGRSAVLGRQSSRNADCHNNLGFQPDELTDKLRETLTSAFGPSRLNGHILAVHVTVLPHSLAKRFEKVLIRGRRLSADEPDARVSAQLLPHSRKRRNAEQ